MPIQFIQPNGLPAPLGYSQVVVVGQEQTVYIAGQIAVNQAGEIVGNDDFLVQTKQVYENLRLALNAVGATFDDVIKTTTYVVDTDAQKLTLVGQVRKQYHTSSHLPVSTYVGVQRLAIDGLLIEIEAIAVVR